MGALLPDGFWQGLAEQRQSAYGGAICWTRYSQQVNYRFILPF